MPQSALPLFVSFNDIIAGRGFVARVALQGRAQLVEEADGCCWVYGVQPGALAEGGASVAEALQGFREGYQSVLFDIAEESATFRDFKSAVTRFFEQTTQADVDEWQAARDKVRQSGVTLPGLRSEQGDVHPKLEVEELHSSNAQPAANRLVQFSQAA